MAAAKKAGLVSLTVLLFVVGATGCDRFRPDFCTVTVKRGIGHFSFEYASRYRVNLVEVRDSYSDVNLSGPPHVKDMVSTQGSVAVISWTSEPDIKQIVDKDIKNWETPNTYPDPGNFVLIERSPTTLDGIAGEQVKYSADSLLTVSDIARGLTPVTVVSRIVYVGRSGCLWELSWFFQQTDTVTDAAFEADFDHILGTFRFLD
jgi:hypothetical protein